MVSSIDDIVSWQDQASTGPSADLEQPYAKEA